MAYPYFSHDSEVLPAAQALVPLTDIAYAYGFGVYETVRVQGGKCLFLEEHCRRLLGSANIIGLQHGLSVEYVGRAAEELIDRNQADACNLKMLLIGGTRPEDASLYLLCLNPLFPDRKLYKDGAHVITKELERPFPHAKTLNMLPSYLANRDAKAAGAYDALLIDRHGFITEGTSTNFFALKGRTIYGPPESDILLGVTRDKVMHVARRHGFEVEEKKMKPADLAGYDNLFLTSTSAKIMPIRSVDRLELAPPGQALEELMEQFNTFLHPVDP